MTTSLIAGGGLMLAAAAMILAADSEQVPANLVGSYTFVSGEKFGDKLTAEHLTGAQVRITEREIIGTDRDDKRTYVATYKLDATHKPWRISMVATVPSAGEKAEGLVEIDGDRVKLIYALPGGETPREFKTKDRQLMFVLKSGDTVPGRAE